MTNIIIAAVHEALAQAADKTARRLYDLACGVPAEYAQDLDDHGWEMEQLGMRLRGKRWHLGRRVKPAVRV